MKLTPLKATRLVIFQNDAQPLQFFRPFCFEMGIGVAEEATVVTAKLSGDPGREGSVAGGRRLR